MKKKMFVLLFIIILPFTTTIGQEANDIILKYLKSSKNKGISISDFFVNALINKQFSIALCRAKSFKELYKQGEYILGKKLIGCHLIQNVYKLLSRSKAFLIRQSFIMSL